MLPGFRAAARNESLRVVTLVLDLDQQLAGVDCLNNGSLYESGPLLDLVLGNRRSRGHCVEDKDPEVDFTVGDHAWFDETGSCKIPWVSKKREKKNF